MTIIYMIPTDRIDKNVGSSFKQIAIEGAYGDLFSWCTSKIDNFTDSLIMLEAAYSGEGSALEQAMKIERKSVIGWNNPWAHMIIEYENDEELPVPLKQIKEMYDGGLPDTENYSRYWHGYLVFVKPIMFLTNYIGLRVINSVVQIALLGLIVFLFFKKGRKELLLPYLISIGFLCLPVTAINIQFSTCYYIITISVILMLLLGEKLKNKENFFFLYIGISVAFFDFLTYPLATFGIPAVLYFCMNMNGEKSLKENILKLVKLLFCWCFGYGLMWGIKWIWATAFTDQNVIFEAFNQIALRTSVADEGRALSAFDAISSNLHWFFDTPFTIIMIVFLATECIICVKKQMKKKLPAKEILKMAAPFLIIGALPFIWYSLTVNHSCIHSWFTHKTLIMSVLALICIPLQIKNSLKS